MSDSVRAKVVGSGIPVVGNDIDTDRIIPARFMKCVTFDGLEEYAFYDVRYDENAEKKNHPFNDTKYAGGSILIVNQNFGCGSSREHAPQALMRFGVAAIVGETFAEIFAGNCASLGVPAVRASQGDVEALQAFAQANPQEAIRVDLESKTVGYGGTSISVDLPESARLDLIKGSWDTTAQLLDGLDEIKNTVASLPYMNAFA
jgi:3-isopropylmalate/(R)-2-methylmalate dehydratase small subunit